MLVRGTAWYSDTCAAPQMLGDGAGRSVLARTVVLSPMTARMSLLSLTSAVLPGS